MSQRNFIVSIIGRLVGLFTSFAGRSIFVSVLSREYLGLGGFFGNIFSIVSLCELGIGAAIAQSLYKPLARNDGALVSSIVRYYTKVCRIVALVSTAVCVLFTPFVYSLCEGSIDKNTVIAAYLLFVLHSALGYLLTPKCALVVCDQRMYIVTLVRSVFSVFALAVQSAALLMTGNYILYLFCRIFVLTVEDVIINIYADKKYPCLALQGNVTRDYKRKIFSNVRALMWHKVGGVLSRSTDSLLLTYFVGLSGMGKYSNYALVIGSIGAFFDVAINAVGASVGNLGAGDRGKKSERVMRRLYFLNFWLLTVGTSVLVSTLNPFIALWLGEDMLFSDAEMLVIVLSFYFSCIRDPVQVFVSTFGLFRQSRHIPILRAAANLVFSVILVNRMGVAGVFLGTAASTCLVPLFGEVMVLYKYGFSMKAGMFCKEMTGFILESFLCAGICFVLTANVATDMSGLLLRCIISFGVSNLLLLLMSVNKPVFKEVLELVSRFLPSFLRHSFEK